MQSVKGIYGSDLECGSTETLTTNCSHNNIAEQLVKSHRQVPWPGGGSQNGRVSNPVPKRAQSKFCSHREIQLSPATSHLTQVQLGGAETEPE